jgi:hypothetical protein
MRCLKRIWSWFERRLIKSKPLADLTPEQRFWVLYAERASGIDICLDTKE